MSKNELQDQALELEIEELEEDLSDDIEGEDHEPTEDIEALQEHISKLEKQNKAIRDELVKTRKKARKSSPKAPVEVRLPENYPSSDELRLASRGLEDDEIAQVIKIARLEDISATEALNSSLYTLWKQSKEEEKRSQEASVGASKSSRVKKRDPSHVAVKANKGEGVSQEEIASFINHKYNINK